MPFKLTQLTVRCIMPLPHPYADTHSDHRVTDHANCACAHHTRLHACVVSGLGKPADTHTASASSMSSRMHVGAARDVKPRLASLPFMHGDEHACHRVSTRQYTELHVSVLHARDDAGAVRFASTHASASPCTAPSTTQDTSRYCVPPPHGTLHGSHSPGAYTITCDRVAFGGK